MDRNKAREILGDTVQENGDLKCMSPYVRWEKRYGDSLKLDGDFDAEDLLAIAYWISPQPGAELTGHSEDKTYKDPFGHGHDLME